MKTVLALFLIISLKFKPKQVKSFEMSEENNEIKFCQKFSIVSVRYNYTCNEKYMKIAIQDNGKRDDFVFNASFETFHSFSQFKFISNLALPKNIDDNEFQIEFNKASIDLCLLSKGITTNMFYQKFLNIFFASSSGELMECPTRIESRSFKNCNVSGIQLPALVPDTRFKLNIKLVVRLAETRKMVQLCEVVITAEHKK